MGFWMYILQCSDGSYYTGHTDDIEKRMAQHHTNDIPGYTSRRQPVHLVFLEEFMTREEALARERQLKGWGCKKNRR